MAMRATGFNQDSDKIFPFSSTKKRMSVLVKAPGSSSKGSKLLLAKGAAEAMIALCTHQLDAKGKAQDIKAQDRARVLAQVDQALYIAPRSFSQGSVPTLHFAHDGD